MAYKRSAAGLLRVIEARGWSNYRAARELGINRTTLIGIRKGRQLPGLRTMDAVEAALPEYTRDYLFPKTTTNGAA